MAVSRPLCLTKGSDVHRRDSHRRGNTLRKKCLVMVKQQKTRFYILGRCVSMLLCWHAHSLSD
ncbi:hypothetical protein Taro_050383 [Colocasia esculenta]|uniref:Uncharacterized protein n=1 Tax=Colocasia esculenta TaxID=4460 RepID=A0A843XDP8_COLES|nr:hypothetical protein [Colocasia esculenta]